MIDARTQAALERLTSNEKECLRRRLRPQTAKEMALDLGISPHAVEKRLKMARTKLGLSSSLEAARLLDEFERYQPTAPQPSDLETPAMPGQSKRGRLLALGVIIMGICAAIFLAYATQTGPVVDDAPPPAEAAGPPVAPEYLSASASPEQVEDYVKDFFAKFDRDGSGFIEPSEGPSSIGTSCCGGMKTEPLTGEAAWQRFLSDNSDDGDNRISFAEFRAARYDRLLDDGIPVRREEVIRVGSRQSPYREDQPGDAPIRFSAEDLDYTPASPERVRAYVRQMFDNWDVDRSGFLELPEAPAMLITQPARLDADGRATLDLANPGKRLEGDEARRQYIANVDKDGDGKVSFEEYAEPVVPQYLGRGIPLIPADWTPAPPEQH